MGHGLHSFGVMHSESLCCGIFGNYSISMKNGITISLFSFSIISSSFLFPFPLFFDLSSFRLPCFFVIIRETNEKQERKKAPGLVSSHHHHPPPPHSPLILYPPSFCLPEWQLAASRVHWACQPKCRFLPTDLREYTFERDRLVCALALYLLWLLFFSLSLAFSFLLIAQTHAAHVTPPPQHTHTPSPLLWCPQTSVVI